MKSLVLPISAAVAALTLAGGAGASEFDARLRDLATSQIADWVRDPAILAAIRAQNAVTASYTEDQIRTLDEAWRAEVGRSPAPTVDPVLGSPASDILRSRRDTSAGLYTEIFVMDARGLNVAASDATSDYWQGDEAKWQQTYAAGPDAVHISDVEKDESTQTYQAQVSVPVVDPATGTPIGAITVGVNVAKLN